MRIVSLLPSATEIVYALGLGDELVGVTFECDEPAAARVDKAVVVGGRDTSGMAPGEIDDYVRSQVAAGADLYTLHAEALAGLDPELILTQDLCRVCALPSGQVVGRARLPRLSGRCRLARPALARRSARDDPRGRTPHRSRPVRRGLVARLRERLASVAKAVAGQPRPRVAVVEWVDPPFTAGHWVPDLVVAAGGAPVAARPGAGRSRRPGPISLPPGPTSWWWRRAGSIWTVRPSRRWRPCAGGRAAAGGGDLGDRRRRHRGPARTAAGRRGRGAGLDPASGRPRSACPRGASRVRLVRGPACDPSPPSGLSTGWLRMIRVIR